MNVGLVVPGFSADATDWCIPALRHLTRELAPNAHVRVIAVRYPYRCSRYNIEGTEVIALGGAEARGPRTLNLWQRTLGTVAAEHRRRRFDVLHAFWATESGLLAALAGRAFRIPTLVSLAGGELVGLRDIGYGDQRSAWERLKVSAALRLARAVSAGSRYLVRIAQHFRTPVEMLPLGVDTTLFRPANRSQSARLLHVGTLTPVKDQRLLLEALAELRKRGVDVALDIVGDGPLRAGLEERARTLELARAVRFLGAVDHADLASIYQAARLFVVTSRHEAQCMVALEAASCGIPVVGTNVGVVPDLAPDATVAVGDASALARVLQATATSSSRDLVEREFALDVCARGFLECYARLAA
jgi:glycosyltransferase involved in cell wall biosynthesis